MFCCCYLLNCERLWRVTPVNCLWIIMYFSRCTGRGYCLRSGCLKCTEPVSLSGDEGWIHAQIALFLRITHGGFCSETAPKKRPVKNRLEPWSKEILSITHYCSHSRTWCKYKYDEIKIRQIWSSRLKPNRLNLCLRLSNKCEEPVLGVRWSF